MSEPELTERERLWADRVLVSDQARTELEKELERAKTELAEWIQAADRSKQVAEGAHEELKTVRAALESITTAQAQAEAVPNARPRRVRLLVGQGRAPEGTVVDMGSFGVVVDWDSGLRAQYVIFGALEPIESE